MQSQTARQISMEGAQSPASGAALQRRSRRGWIIGGETDPYGLAGTSGMPGTPANEDPACFARAPLEEAVGRLVAERAKAAGVDRVVFDRGGYLFHGRVKALAEGARAAGLQF